VLCRACLPDFRTPDGHWISEKHFRHLLSIVQKNERLRTAIIEMQELGNLPT
jgi:hypothetical protein